MYTLRFPFSLPAGREIEGMPVFGNLHGLTFSMEKQDRFYVFTLNGFPTEDTAKTYINNVWTGLMWLLLHLGLPAEAVFEPGRVVYPKDPIETNKYYQFREPRDAFLDGGSAGSISYRKTHLH